MQPTRNPTVLTCASNTLLAALIGALVELDMFIPLFSGVGESCADAVRRTRPAAVLLDADTAEREGAALVGRAAMLSLPMLLFGGADDVSRLETLSARLGVRCVILPGDHDRVRQRLTTELRAVGR